MLKQKKKYNIFDDIQKIAEKYPKNIALQAGNNSLTYFELITEVKAKSEFFKNIFNSEYLKCVFVGDDSIEYIIVSLALIASRSVFVSAGKEITSKKYNSILDDISVDITILQDNYTKKLQPKNYDLVEKFTVANKSFSIYKSKIKKYNSSSNEQLQKEFESLNPAFIRFTSGTTSQSKGVVLSHTTIRERTESANTVFEISANDKVLWLLPMAYHFAVTIILFLRKGCTIDIAVDMQVDKLLHKLVNDKITFVYATPFHYSKISKVTNKKIDLPKSIRMLISTAMPLTESIALDFYKKFNRYLNQAYGIIECGLPCINKKPNINNVLTVGSQVPGSFVSVALKDEKDNFGEIVVKSIGMFDAYYSPWHKTKDITCKGFFYTGDIGKFENGCLKIIGRKKNIINYLGHKVFPEQIENIIMEHDAIKEVFVFSEPHTEYGEIIICEIVLHTNKKVSENELTRFCAKKLSSQEIPNEFRIVKALQKTPNGKIKRF